jgi:hypothetical protein
MKNFAAYLKKTYNGQVKVPQHMHGSSKVIGQIANPWGPSKQYIPNYDDAE